MRTSRAATSCHCGKPAYPCLRLPEEAHLILVNGDRIPVDAPRLVEERLHFRHPDLAGGKETQVPLSAVSVLWLNAPRQRRSGAIAATG